MRTAISLAASLLLAACTTSAAAPQPAPPAAPVGVQFSVEPMVTAPGATVTLVLDNRAGGQIGFNLCSSALIRWSGSGWETIPQDGVCTRELRIVGSGQQARYQMRLPARLAAGHYHYRTRIERLPDVAGAGPIISLPFEVRR